MASGDILTINYPTRRQTDRYTHRVFGIQMELKDSAGTITKTNQIIDCIDGETTNRTISVTVPAGAADGAAEVGLRCGRSAGTTTTTMTNSTTATTPAIRANCWP